MNWLDYAFIGALCIAAGLGFWSGLFWQVYALLCLILSYFSAVFFYYLPERFFIDKLSPGVASVLGHIIVFGAVLAASLGLGILLRRVLFYPGVTGRILGGVLGLLQGVVICGVVAVGLKEYSTGILRQASDESIAVTTLAQGGYFLSALIPKDIRNNFEGLKETAKEAIEGAKRGLQNKE